MEEKHPRSKDGDVGRKKDGIDGAEVVVGWDEIQQVRIFFTPFTDKGIKEHRAAVNYGPRAGVL